MVSTFIVAKEGETLPFQEYFVKKSFSPHVRDIVFKGIEYANPTMEVINALSSADAIVLCPSNPFVSIGPILSLAGIKDILLTKQTVAVSPIIGGKAIKGPLAKMMYEMDYEVSPISISDMYSDFLNVMYVDSSEDIQDGLELLVAVLEGDAQVLDLRLVELALLLQGGEQAPEPSPSAPEPAPPAALFAQCPSWRPQPSNMNRMAKPYQTV